jgi:hypothetical protein
MTKRKCKCPPDSPFHWMHNPRPSMFLNDPKFNQNAKLSQNQTAVVEREREQGRDISNLPGVTKKFSYAERISVKQFTVYARAGRVL